MGAKHSKPAKRDGKRSPNSEKHVSADSTTPLTALGLRRSSTVDEKHYSFNGGNPSFGDTTITADDDAITPLPVIIHETEGHSNVSRPPPPPHKHHLSELIDPATLPIDAHVRSPSGNLLAPEQFLVHPDRPRSIRERQEEILEKVRAVSRLGMQEDAEPAVPVKQNGKKKRSKSKWLCCCC